MKKMRTKPRSPSTVKTKCNDKVCVVLKPIRSSVVKYFVYIFDPYEKHIALLRRNATIRFVGSVEPPSSMAFSVINSTLYMFCGLEKDDKWLLPSYSLDLKPIMSVIAGPCHVEFPTDLNIVPAMKSQKTNPRAVSIGNQICVFSLTLKCGTSNFELYNPDTHEWSSLPEPPIRYSGAKSCEVCFYGVEKLCFFVCTSKGPYCIDYSREKERRNWTPCDLPVYTEVRHNRHSWLKKGNLLFSPTFHVYDLNTAESFLSEYRDEDDEVDLYARDAAILILPKKGETDRELSTCLVEVGDSRLNDHNTNLKVSLFKFGDDPTNPIRFNFLRFFLDILIETSNIDIAGVFLM